MKTPFLIVASVLFLSVNLFSQTPPTPPKTNSTVSYSKGSSYSINFDTDDTEDNSSVSIKRNDNIYKFNAKFHESKSGSIKKLLVDKLGNSDLKVSNDTYRWMKSENGEKLYDCKLTDSTLKIYVDKEYANTKLVEMMDEFGIVLKDLISGSDSKEEEKRIAESELESAERELERAKKALVNAKKRANN